MKRLVFVHDHPFYRDGNTVYSGGGLPCNTWGNYLINFNEVFVYARNSNNLKDKKAVSSASNVSFYLTNKYTSPIVLIRRINTIKSELEKIIDSSNVVLARLPSVLGFIAADLALKKNKLLWVEQVGNAREALGTQGSFLGKVAAPFFEYKNKKIVNSADFVSYVTASKLQKDYPPNIKAKVAAMSDVIIKKVLGEDELINNRYFGSVFRIGLIGACDVKYKGQDILLYAISSLEENVKKKIQISLVGKGDYSWILYLAEKLNLKDNIEFIGSLEAGDEINDFLQSLSLYVQPSLTEGMPRATIEAMAMGCPVIGSNVGGIPDIVSVKFVHTKGRSKELAKHINYLYYNREALYQEAVSSLGKALPYKKEILDCKRLEFYSKMNDIIANEK